MCQVQQVYHYHINKVHFRKVSDPNFWIVKSYLLNNPATSLAKGLYTLYLQPKPKRMRFTVWNAIPCYPKKYFKDIKFTLLIVLTLFFQMFLLTPWKHQGSFNFPMFSGKPKGSIRNRCVKNFISRYETLCAIWYHLYNLKNVKNTHGRVLNFSKVAGSALHLYKKYTPPWVFFTFFKIVQIVPTHAKHQICTVP